MRFKVRLEHNPELTDVLAFKAVLYEVRPSGKLRYVAVAHSDTREDALDRIRRKRDAFMSRREPEWLDLEDGSPEPMSLKADVRVIGVTSRTV